MNEEYVKIGIYISIVVILLTKSDSFLSNWAKLFLITVVGYYLAQGVMNLP